MRVAGPEAVAVGEGRAEGVELLTFTTCSLVLRQGSAPYLSSEETVASLFR